MLAPVDHQLKLVVNENDFPATFCSQHYNKFLGGC